jgi:hypothetical protein
VALRTTFHSASALERPGWHYLATAPSTLHSGTGLQANRASAFPTHCSIGSSNDGSGGVGSTGMPQYQELSKVYQSFAHLAEASVVHP